jgi:hypothetical protein
VIGVGCPPRLFWIVPLHGAFLLAVRGFDCIVRIQNPSAKRKHRMSDLSQMPVKSVETRKVDVTYTYGDSKEGTGYHKYKVINLAGLPKP